MRARAETLRHQIFRKLKLIQMYRIVQDVDFKIFVALSLDKHRSEV
jgi:hypothetical protein